MKNFLVWSKIVKRYMNIRVFGLIISEYFFYILITYFLVTRSFIFSLFLSYTLVSARLAIKLFYFYKNIQESGKSDLILLKPVDPLFGLLVYNHNPADIFILFPILIYIKIKSYIVKSQKK